MFDSLLSTIIPFASKGVLFYQGESNHQDCTLYEEGFKTMIQGWRRAFKEPALPFVFVQVAGYSYPGTAKDAIQIVREAQQNAIDVSDNKFMVTALDVGEEENIHPKDKTVISRRLANVVLEKIYHQGQNSLSPAYFSYQISGNDIIIFTRFNNLNLISKSGLNLGFKVSYDHETWVDFPHVRLDHSNIIIEKAEKTLEIRYAFEPFPHCDIYTENDLPLLPFRIKIER
jgi:sialate O-acetylesterase